MATLKLEAPGASAPIRLRRQFAVARASASSPERGADPRRIGMTDELALIHYFKRATMIEAVRLVATTCAL